ncbi:MAG: hypothetical protein IKF50_02480 [Clostridia bacterium]|nr:hypothetical protein [Clostridia bacterium]
MRILACFKIVRDLENVIDSDWKSAKDAGFRIDYTKKLINDADQGALETALRIRDEEPETELCAVTASGDDAASFFTGLFAIGYDAGACLIPQTDLTWMPGETAALLARYARETGPYDLILTGAQAPPGDSRQVPYLVAERLGLPCIDHVRTVSHKEGEFIVLRRTQTADETYAVRGLVLLAMEDPQYAYLRVPTLRERLRVKGKKADAIEYGRQMDEIGLRIQELRPARQERKCRFAEADEVPRILGTLLAETGQEGAR